MAAVTTQAVLCTPIIRVIAITKQREERRATRLQAPGYITVVAGDGRPVLCSGHRADWGGKIANWSKMLANANIVYSDQVIWEKFFGCQHDLGNLGANVDTVNIASW